MPTYNQKKQYSDAIKWEVNALYTRERIVVASGQNLDIGTVMGRVTASGNCIPADPSATDGSQTPIGILGVAVDATAGAQPGWIVARSAVAARDGLIFGAGVTTPERTTLEAGLAAIGIVVRDAI